MDDSVLWAVAFGVGTLGLLFLAVAVVVAIYLNIRARRAGPPASVERSRTQAGRVASTDRPQPQGEDAACTGEPEVRAGASDVEHPLGGGFWAWVKAWIFAIAHAGTVSVVLGGVTFFEDMARAGEEIRRTGTVTFPKQLLPGSLPGSSSRKRLTEPSDDLEKLDQPDASSKKTAGWAVVDLLEEASSDDEA
jgi:hypothetical protein